MKKLLLVTALTATGSMAQAQPFYINIGYDFDPASTNTNYAVDTNTTGFLDELTYVYHSNSVITDNDLNGVDVGDTIVTNGGFVNGDLLSVSTNTVTGFKPTDAFGGPSDNGYGDWGITFQINNLAGVIGSAGELFYNSGDITLYYYESTMSATTDFIEIFNISVLGGGQNTAGIFVGGAVTTFGAGNIHGVDVGDVFNFQTPNISFGDYVSTHLATDFLSAVLDLNTDNATFTSGGPGIINATGDHDGSIKFSVPEPGSLALFGLGLLAASTASRRNKK